MQARRLTPWLLVLAMAGLIFAFSAIPSLATGLGFWDLLLRKCAHAVEFGLLAFLIWRALRRELPAAALASGYAASDEYHQTFVSGRVGSVTDWAIDTAGVLLALAGLRLWLHRREQRKQREPRAQNEPEAEAPRHDELSENPR